MQALEREQGRVGAESVELPLEKPMLNAAKLTDPDKAAFVASVGTLQIGKFIEDTFIASFPWTPRRESQARRAALRRIISLAFPARRAPTTNCLKRGYRARDLAFSARGTLSRVTRRAFYVPSRAIMPLAAR